MSLVGFTFGSFGDIVTIAQLLQGIITALSDSKGASSEYQNLIVQLRAFADVLSSVYDTIFDPNSRHPPLSAHTACSLRKELDGCRSQLQSIQKRIDGYQNSLRQGGSGSRMRDSWRKIGWGLFTSRDIAYMRSELIERMARINTFISVSNRYYFPPPLLLALSTDSLLIGSSRALGSMDTTLLEVCRVMDKNMPELLGYAFADQKPIRFTDFLGRNILVPYELCETQRVGIYPSMLKICY